jgi:hypothetical protein
MNCVYKIYRVTLPASINLGYDSYSEFMIVAECEEEARNMHPGCEMPFNSMGEYDIRSDWIQIDKIDQLIVEEIGLANKDHQDTEILTKSYHAG